jgi:hypothetical protein
MIRSEFANPTRKIQTASTKIQKNLKFQKSMPKTFEILDLGPSDLFAICN